MAEVTEITNGSTQIPPDMTAEPPKNQRGRPPGSKNKAKAETKPPEPVDDDYTPEPEFTGNQDFWLMLQNFSDDDWNHLSAYVYRLAPKIDRKANGRKANIQTYTSRFTPDDLMKDHGSGAYQIMLNEQDQATGKYHRLAVEKVQIMNPKYPPVVPDGDWVDDKDNEMWKWGANPAASTSNGGSYPPGFNIAEMMDKADQRALKMVEIMTPKAPPKDDTVLNTLITKLLDKSLTPTPPPDNSAMERIFKMQDDTLQELRKEIRELRNKEAVPQKSIIEQFIEIRPQIKELVDAFATKAAKTDLWATLAEKGIEQIPDLIELGRDFMKKPDQQQNGKQPAAGIAAAPTTTATVTADATKPPEQMTQDEKAAHVDQLWRKWSRRLLDISTKLIEEFTIQDQGYSFRDWYVELYGKLNWAELRRDLGGLDEQGTIHPELVTNMYHAHEQLRKALSPPQRLTAFLVEFFTNFGEEKDVTVEDPAAAVEPDEVIPAGKQSEAKTK